jgi:hypothetical protein
MQRVKLARFIVATLPLWCSSTLSPRTMTSRVARSEHAKQAAEVGCRHVMVHAHEHDEQKEARPRGRAFPVAQMTNLV